MQFCSKCGKEIMDEAEVCPNCGCAGIISWAVSFLISMISMLSFGNIFYLLDDIF